jgi:Predicted signal transduction protein with a C-terminal ATPase domain
MMPENDSERARRARRAIPSLSFKMSFFFALVAIPLAILLIFQNVYAVSVVHRQVAESELNLLRQYQRGIDDDLASIDTYLVSRLVYDRALDVFDRAERDDAFYLAKTDLSIEFNKDVSLYKSAGGIFAYSIASGDLVIGANETKTPLSFADRDALTHLLRADTAIPTKQWIFKSIGSRSLLLRVLKSDAYYLGAWVEASELLAPLAPLKPSASGVFVFAAEDGAVYPTSPVIGSNHIDLASGDLDYKISGAPDKYLVIGVPSRIGSFRLVALTRDADLLQQLPAFRTTNILITISVLILVLAFFLFIRRSMLKPLIELIRAMTKLRKGDFESRAIVDQGSREFAIAGETFNLMASEIRDLRISVYEEQLHAQKAELRSLRLQINPHFFLNSLNILYQLAQIKNYELIKELTLCLSKYFQFMFRNMADLVSLEEEWNHLKYYLRIQELRFPTSLECAFSAPNPIPAIQIPPLLLHTFAENSVKYGIRQNRVLKLAISLTPIGQNEILEIRIADSGPGFPEETLQKIREDTPFVANASEHIGISNIKRRLRLLYAEAADIQFANRPAEDGGGAIVTIRIPCAHPDANSN